MKKALLLTALISSAVVAHADKPADGWDMTNASCTNLGSMIFKGQKGVVPHLLAMTTNTYSSSLVAFGVTTGTMECDTSRPVARIRPFVDKNMEMLASDISRGQGESLDALAALLNVKIEDQALFNQTMQKQFVTVFSNEQMTSGQVIANIMSVLSTDAKLAVYIG